MDSSVLKPPSRAPFLAFATVFAILCLWPHLPRARYPSIYGDDIVRIADERVFGVMPLLFRPFNEHMAPMFEALTGVCWQLSFGRLARAPVAFTWASYLPFFLILPLLYRVLREETGSLTSALVATSAFSLSWLHVETIGWYSASSFMWSLLGTLVAWRAAARASSRTDARATLRARVVGIIAACLAPAFSAIGLLAGPLAGLRAFFGREGRDWKNVGAPWIGTFLYLAVCLAHRYGNHIAANVAQKGNLKLGLLAIGIAPVDVLVPALFGVGNLHRILPNAIAVVATLALTAIAGVWAARSRFRALILGGLALIFGGYALTYPVRTSVLRVDGVLEIQRYHLFPQLGLCFIVAAGLASLGIVKRFDARPILGWSIAIAAAAILNLAHDRTIGARFNFYRYPDQPHALAALDHVADLCKQERIPRAQAIRVFDPVLTKWFPYEGFNQLDMLPPTVEKASLSDEEARARILKSLSPNELEAFLGGTTATKHVVAFALLDPAETVAVATRRRLFRVREVGPGRFVSEGWPSFVEYDLNLSKPEVKDLFLVAIGGDPSEYTLIFWNDSDADWSESRQARVKVSSFGIAQGWALPLSSLPHWRPERSRRLRVGIQTPGPFRLDSVELHRSVKPIPPL